MKKALITLTALLTLLVISPAMAAPKTKSPFESNVIFFATYPSVGQYQITQDGIMYVYGVEAIGENSVQGPAIFGDLWTKLSGVGDLNTGQGSFQGEFRISNAIGDFEGKVRGTVTTDPQGTTARVAGSFVGFGTRGYTHQKIKGSFDGSVVYGILQVTLTVNGVLQNKEA